MLQKEYDNKVKELKERLDQLLNWIDLESKQNRIKEIEFEIQDPDLWKDSKKAEIILKELGDLKNITSVFVESQNDLEKIFSNKSNLMVDEIYALERNIKKIEIKRLFQGKWDKNNAVVSVYAGAGGLDAADWTHMLYKMYEQYALNQDWKVEVVDSAQETFESKTGRVPLKNITFEIEGKYAFGYLKKESGVHRLVRISPFSSDDLRHTSFALVEVIPKIEEKTLEIKDSDLKVEFFRSSGPGGQNVNKVETAVRIVHMPTGLVASAQVERSQSQNRERAMRMLEAKIIQLMEKERVEEIGLLKTKIKPEWGSQIRSYILNPYKLVKDHRTNYETTAVENVIEEGELGEFIYAELTS